ncbi:MAG: thermonuclease family protein [Candidatus Aenigmatarchaeota archaeon]
MVRVIDGDTVELDSGEKLRLIGIDAPEPGEPFFQEAKLALKDMVEGKKVFVETDEFFMKDKYGRYVGYILLEGKIINCELVRKGLAKVVMENSLKYDCFKESEKIAKSEHLGVWSSSK